MTSFVELIKNSNGATHIIKTYDDQQRKCWFLLKANEIGIKKLSHTTPDQIIDLTQYGEVIASGWGHEAEQN